MVAATSDDVPLILDLIRELAEYERLPHQVLATQEELRDSLFGSQPGAEVILAYAGTDAVGFALFFHNYSTFLGRRGIWLEDLFVRPHWRGRGVGSRLLAHVAELAVERGCGRLEWWVLDWNQPAIRFYERLGAVRMDDWTVYRMTGEELRRLGSSRGDASQGRVRRDLTSFVPSTTADNP
ncbi:MAG: GNAT family N-acetyltransferase [Gemmatimonadetes bacterium]|nr:GNAT family N-acetyltransferase [Gemmatimonadota bacterium]